MCASEQAKGKDRSLSGRCSVGRCRNSCYVNIATLGANRKRKRKSWIVLEFSRRQPSVCSDILNNSLFVVFGEVGLGGHAEHSLDRVHEENGDEAGWLLVL